MSDAPDDGHGPFGSLVELFPHLAGTPDEVPYAKVHVRALAFEEGAELTLGFVVWDDPGGAAALRREIGRRIENALLALLARPASTLDDEGERRPSRIRVLCFGAPIPDADAALAPFGLVPRTRSATELAATMGHVRGEAQRCGAQVPEAPTTVYEVEVRLPDGERGAVVEAIEGAMRETVADAVWGAVPGAFFRALATVLAARGEPPLEPRLESIDRIETLAGQLVPGRVRWMPPMVFQALCDAVGVVASREFARRVDWAACEPDDDGLAPPPLLRAKLPDGTVHIPIGEHVLRWSMMPLAVGEVPPTLGEWVLDQFGDRGGGR